MEGRPSAPERAKQKNGEIGQGSQRHPARYTEKLPWLYSEQHERGYRGVERNAQHP